MFVVKRVLALSLLISMGTIAGYAQSQQIPPQFFGMHSSYTGHWPGVPFGAIRMWDNGGTAWNGLETSRGNYNFTNLDKWLSLAQSHNIDVLYTFGKVPQWASSQPYATGCATPGGCAPPANITDWDNFVRALVTHAAGRIKYYELWNEPNAPNWWIGTPQQLVTLSQHAYQIIKSVDPSAIVLSPAPQGTYSFQWIDMLLTAGGGPYFDVISYHGYVQHLQPEAELLSLSRLRSTMAAHGVSNKPIWDTEVSWDDDSWYPVSIQPQFLARLTVLSAFSGVQHLFWYGWDYTPHGELWDPTNGIHPSGLAWAQVYKWLVNNKTSGPCVSDSNGTYTCSMTTSAAVPEMIVWNVNGNTSYLPPAVYTSYQTLTGGTGAINGSITIGVVPMLLAASGSSKSQPPVAALSVSPTSGTGTVTVTADGSKSYDPDGNIVSENINFGDGTVISGKLLASHTYTTAGTRNVTLTVIDNAGLSAQAVKSVAIGTSCTLSTVSPSVTICSPLNGSSYSGSTHVVGGATSSVGVAFIQIAVDYKVIYQVNGNRVDTLLNLAPGTHRLTVQFSDKLGHFTGKAIYVTVQ